MTKNMRHGVYKLILIQILRCLHRTGWIKTRPAQKLLVRVKFTGNSYSYRTCVNVNGHRLNTCKLVFTGTRIRALVLVSMWIHPNTYLLGEEKLTAAAADCDGTDAG